MEDLYPMIFRRYSARRFSSHLTEKDQERIQLILKELTPLDPKAAHEFVLGPSKGRGDVSINLYMKDREPASLLQAGFLLEEADLALEQAGYGICFLGMAKAEKGLEQKDGLVFLMSLDCGQVLKESFRKSPDDFTRNYINDIWAGEFNPEIKQAARLSPSAINSQPWQIISSADQKKIEVFRKRAPFNPIPDETMRFFHFVDLGILVSHLKIALDHFKIPYALEAVIGPEEGRLTRVAVFTLA